MFATRAYCKCNLLRIKGRTSENTHTHILQSLLHPNQSPSHRRTESNLRKDSHCTNPLTDQRRFKWIVIGGQYPLIHPKQFICSLLQSAPRVRWMGEALLISCFIFTSAERGTHPILIIFSFFILAWSSLRRKWSRELAAGERKVL